jgi:hypothetical protein
MVKYFLQIRAMGYLDSYGNLNFLQKNKIDSILKMVMVNIWMCLKQKLKKDNV